MVVANWISNGPSRRSTGVSVVAAKKDCAVTTIGDWGIVGDGEVDELAVEEVVFEAVCAGVGLTFTDGNKLCATEITSLIAGATMVCTMAAWGGMLCMTLGWLKMPPRNAAHAAMKEASVVITLI